MSAKYFDELYYPNSHYAKVGGMTLTEMNQSEIDFLRLIHYRLFVHPYNFNVYKQKFMFCGR